MMKKISWTQHFIELIIVIIGISIAFWLNNLASQAKEGKLEQSFIQELKTDLLKDTTQLRYCMKFNRQKVRALQKALEIINADTRRQHADSAFQYASYVGNYVFFYPDNFTLTSLLQSGDIRHLKSAQLKKELQRLLSIYERIDETQKNFLSALDQNYFPELMQHIDMSTYELVNPAYIYSLPFKNYCAYARADTGNHSQLYQEAVSQIEKLLEIMDT